MFERFTDRARRVVVLAQEEARLLNHNYIGTEHLLLALINEGEGVAAQALGALDVSLEAVRSRVEELIGTGGTSPSGHIPFTPRAKKVLENALREALRLGHNYIGTEHLLLGLVREGQGVAAQVLTEMDVELERVRDLVVGILEAEGSERADRDDTSAETEGSDLLVDSLTSEVGRLRRDVDRLRDALRRLEAPSPPAKAKPELAPSTYQTLLRCSFCDARQEDVAKLVAGPGVFICDRCIALCQEILDEGPAEPEPPTDP